MQVPAHAAGPEAEPDQSWPDENRRVPAATREARRSTIEHLIFQYGIIMLAVVVAINEVGVPTGLPVEAVILLAGAFAVNSVPELLFAIALVTAADVLGGVALYFATRAGGSRLLNRLLRRLSGRSEDILERWRHRL